MWIEVKIAMITEFCVVAFVQKYFAANFLHNNVPGVNRSCTTHKGGQNGVCCEYVDFRLGSGQFPDDRIVGCSHSMENTIDPFQISLVLHIDAVV
jgi:hypothetical protein